MQVENCHGCCFYFVWWITWLAVVPLYLAERRVGVKWERGNEPLLKSHESPMIFNEMSLKTCEVRRCDGVHSEAAAAIFKKTDPTLRLLCFEFLQGCGVFTDADPVCSRTRLYLRIVGIGAALPSPV